MTAATTDYRWKRVATREDCLGWICREFPSDALVAAVGYKDGRYHSSIPTISGAGMLLITTVSSLDEALTAAEVAAGIRRGAGAP